MYGVSAVDLLGSFLDNYPTLDRIFRDMGGTTDEKLGLDVVLLRLGMACIIGWLIGQVYRRTFTGRKFAPSLPDTHVLLCLGGAMIWVIVQDSLARAFGLAGTVGLIRYRTIVRDPKDTTLLLFSMVLGMACGLGQYSVSVVGTFVVLFTLLWLHHNDRKQRAAEAEKGQSLLDLMRDDTDDAPPPSLNP
jgi:uncharacterized membrane protein YhiD involved in acid resistance